MRRTLPIIVALGLLAAPAARAAAPELVPVQGVLTDSTGAPVDTSVTVVFSLYTTEVGGTALWTETQSVLVEDGLFTAYMGDVTTLDLTLFRDEGNLWLGIQVDSDAEMDRMLLGSNPFAGYAEHCGSAPAPDFADITGTVDPADLPAGLVTGPLACTGTQKVAGIDSSGALVCAADEGGTSYSAGTGLILTGTTFSLDMTGVQARVTGTCAADSSIRTINSDGSVVCEPDNDTTYSAGTGLALTGTTFSMDTTGLQARITGVCPGGQSIRSVGSDGSVVCELDNDTTYSAGTGLLLMSGNTFAVNQSIFQRRVAGTCAAGNSIRVINTDGSVTCEVDTDTNTTYSAGSGLTLTGTTFSVDTTSLQARVASVCAAGSSIRQINSDGSVICEVDDDMGYTVGSGLSLSGDLLTVDRTTVQTRVSGTCAAGNSIREIWQNGTVVCEPDTNTTYNAGSGLNLTGTTFSVDTSTLQARVTGTCAPGFAIRTISDIGSVGCEFDNDTTYSAGTGILLSGTTLSADMAYLQRRVTGTCAAGSAIRTVWGSGTVLCEAFGDGDITAVNAGLGLAGGGTSGSVTISANTSYLQRRVSATCGVSEAISVINADGSVTCQPVYGGDITGVYPGTGLAGGASTGNATLWADTTYLQRRVVGTCPVNTAVRTITETGGVTCQQVYDGDVTEVIAGTGLSGGGTTGAVTLNIGPHAQVGSWYGAPTAVSGDNYMFGTGGVVLPMFGSCHVTSTAWFSDQEVADDGDQALLQTARFTVGSGTSEADPNPGPYMIGTGAGIGISATTSHSWSTSASTTYRFGCYVWAPPDAVGDTIHCRVSWICHPYA